MKRGQTSAFIFMAVIVLFLVLFMIFIFSFFKEKDIEKASQNFADTVDFAGEIEYVNNCMDLFAKPSIKLIADQGGFLDPPLTVYQDDSPPLAVHIDDGARHMPIQTQVQSDVGKAFMPNFIDCLDKNTFGLEYTTGTVSVGFSEHDVTFTLDFPITMTNGERTKTQSKFIHVERNMRFSTLLTVAEKVADAYGNQICLSCLSEIGTEHFVEVHVQDITAEHVLYYVSDYFADEEPFIMQFAHRIS